MMRNDNLIKKINELCELQNLTVSELLSKAKLSSQLVDDWTANKCVPSLSALSSICEVLNVELSYLFKTDENTLTQSQKVILNEWRQLSQVEKEAISQYILALKNVKNEKE